VSRLSIATTSGVVRGIRERDLCAAYLLGNARTADCCWICYRSFGLIPDRVSSSSAKPVRAPNNRSESVLSGCNCGSEPGWTAAHDEKVHHLKFKSNSVYMELWDDTDFASARFLLPSQSKNVRW
jgi:hypothetical protein